MKAFQHQPFYVQLMILGINVHFVFPCMEKGLYKQPFKCSETAVVHSKPPCAEAHFRLAINHL